MLSEQQGEIFRSRPISWASGQTSELPLDFLFPTRRWGAPVIRSLVFHLNFSDIAGVTATLLAKDAYKAFSRVQIFDGGGMIYDLSGTLARVVEQMELGTRQREPNDGTALASGTSSTDYDVFLRVIFSPPKSRRPADFHVPVPFITDGGQILTTFASPPGATTANTGTMRVYADCVDERKRELKSRMVWKERAISAQEDDYAIGGLLRAAFVSSSLTTTGYTSLAEATYATFESKTLGYSSLDTDILRERYRMQSPDWATQDEFLAGTAYGALPVLTPYEGQKIVGMTDLQTIHVNLQAAAPASGRLVSCAITDRVPDQSAAWAGFSSVGELVAALRERGIVAAEKGQTVIAGDKDGRKVDFWPPELVRKLPLKFL